MIIDQIIKVGKQPIAWRIQMKAEKAIREIKRSGEGQTWRQLGLRGGGWDQQVSEVRLVG